MSELASDARELAEALREDYGEDEWADRFERIAEFEEERNGD